MFVRGESPSTSGSWTGSSEAMITTKMEVVAEEKTAGTSTLPCDLKWPPRP
jgi:hypothetical protein